MSREAVRFTSAACLAVSFLMIVQTSLEQDVHLSSSKNVYYEGDNATLTCIAYGSASIKWILNGTHYNETFVMNGIIKEFSTILGIGILSIFKINSSYDFMTIQCCPAYDSEETLFSNLVTIRVQGKLDGVSNISISIVNNYIQNITWKDPFTLNVPGVHPDITYCLEVSNTHLHNRIHSVCNINDTFYTCQNCPPVDDCIDYSVNIIATNKVGNSTPATKQLWSTDFDVQSIKLYSNGTFKIVEIFLTQYICISTLSVKVYKGRNMTVLSNGVSDIVKLQAIDNIKYDDVVLNSTKSTESVIRHLGSISTFDVQNITIFIDKNRVCLTPQFVSNSDCKGVYYCLISLENDIIAFKNSLYILTGRNKLNGNGTYCSHISGNITILAYDIESNGHIEIRALPAFVQEVTIPGNHRPTFTPNNRICEIKKSSRSINMTCYCEEKYYVAWQYYNGTIESIYPLTVERTNCYKRTTILTQPGTYMIKVYSAKKGTDRDGILNATVIFTKEIVISKSMKTSSNFLIFFISALVGLLSQQYLVV